MANKTHFSPASEKGRFNGLVDEGEYLRQSSLYKQIMPRTPSRIRIICVNPVNLVKKTSCPYCLRGEKIRKISVNPWLINDLRLFKELYIRRDSSTDIEESLQINLFLQNKPNFRKVKLNVNRVLTKDYEDRTLGQAGKTNPIQTQFKANQTQSNPIKANKMPKQTQYKPNTKSQTRPWRACKPSVWRDKGKKWSRGANVRIEKSAISHNSVSKYM